MTVFIVTAGNDKQSHMYVEQFFESAGWDFFFQKEQLGRKFFFIPTAEECQRTIRTFRVARHMYRRGVLELASYV